MTFCKVLCKVLLNQWNAEEMTLSYMQGQNWPCLFHKRIFIERRIATYVLQYSSHCKTCPSQLCEICAHQKEIFFSFNSLCELFTDTPAGFFIQFLRECNLLYILIIGLWQVYMSSFYVSNATDGLLQYACVSLFVSKTHSNLFCLQEKKQWLFYFAILGIKGSNSTFEFRTSKLNLKKN